MEYCCHVTGADCYASSTVQRRSSCGRSLLPASIETMPNRHPQPMPNRRRSCLRRCSSNRAIDAPGRRMSRLDHRHRSEPVWRAASSGEHVPVMPAASRNVSQLKAGRRFEVRLASYASNKCGCDAVDERQLLGDRLRLARFIGKIIVAIAHLDVVHELMRE